MTDWSTVPDMEELRRLSPDEMKRIADAQTWRMVKGVMGEEFVSTAKIVQRLAGWQLGVNRVKEILVEARRQGLVVRQERANEDWWRTT